MTVAILVVSAALFGGVLVWGMLTLLYWPRLPMALGPVTLHGAIYRAWPAIVSEASKMLTSELSADELVGQLLESVDLEEELRQLLDKRLAGVIKGAAEGMPLVAAFVSDELVESIKGQVMKQALLLVPEIKKTFVERAAGQLNIASVVNEKLSSIDLDRLDTLCRDVVSSRLGAAVSAGAAVGALVGMVQGFLLRLFA